MYVTSANECYALDAGTGRADLAVSAAADEGPHRQRRRRRQSRRVGRRRRVFMVTDHAHVIALDRHDRRAALGHRDGRLAPELQRDRRSAAGRQPRHHRHVRRRRGRARIRGGIRPGDRQGSVALLDGAEARRAGIGNVAGQRHRSSRRHDVDDRHLRSASSTRSTGRRQSRPRSHRRRSARRQPLHGFGRRARREDRAAQVALPVHAARRLGLRRAGNAGARRRQLAGTAAQAARAGQSQRLLLRARSHQRRVPVRHSST